MGYSSPSCCALHDRADKVDVSADEPTLVDQSILALLLSTDREWLMSWGHQATAIQLVSLGSGGVEQGAKAAIYKPSDSADVHFLAAEGLRDPEGVAVLKGKETLGIITLSRHGGNMESAMRAGEPG